MTLLSLDPGRQGFGVAAFPGACLAAATVVPQPQHPPHTQPSIADTAAHVVTVLRPLLTHLPPITSVVIERMRVYPRVRRAGARQETEQARTAKANDLLDLQAIGALVAAHFAHPSVIVYRTAPEWKGSTTAEAIEARLDVWRGWSAGEIGAWGRVRGIGKTLRHNAVEAVALGLGYLGRIRWT